MDVVYIFGGYGNFLSWFFVVLVFRSRSCSGVGVFDLVCGVCLYVSIVWSGEFFVLGLFLLGGCCFGIGWKDVFFWNMWSFGF